ncbi:MAG: two component, sigma54 specific, transcriptional regulator, Fis family [Myxococcales bacterium]|nr:two component, sigma54 specific, transcriptional regulator, Fis family [Myxococcales bacterium]
MSDILVIEDHATSAESVRQILERLGHTVAVAGDAESGLAAFAAGRFDLVVTDLRLPRGDGLSVVRTVKATAPECAVIVVTAYGTVETALEAVRSGAFHFLTKPIRIEELELTVQNALRQRTLDVELGRLRSEKAAERVGVESRLTELLGESAAMAKVAGVVRQVASSTTTVLIRGESGTGKELVARAVHELSPRQDAPFIEANCAAFAPGVLESELFGHEKGAFTGAIAARRGRFELADGGTLFLDEVGDLPLEVQVKLLRVLQERSFERVGGTKTVRVDCRLIAATNRNLEQAMREGKFREDLFYRLNVVPIVLPPLRERSEDIPRLAALFLDRFNRQLGKSVRTLAPDALAALAAYHWPGNVRELENLVERMVVLAAGDVIRIGDLPAEVGHRQAPSIALPDGDVDLTAYLEAIEREIIVRALERAGGIKQRAAESLKLERNALRYKLKKYGLE